MASSTPKLTVNMASLTGGLIDRSSILTGMILHHVEKKSDHTCRFSVSSELKPTQDTGYLDHLPGSDKRMLSTAVKLWTRNLVIRQRVEDFQLVVFPVNNNERKIMRFNKIYNISDGMLTRILEALAYRVKEFKIKRLNPGMNTRFWTQKDVTRSKEFIAAIETEDEKDLPEPRMLLGFNPLVHSFRALSTLRRFGLRTASAAAKPCQRDSSEVYLITGEKCEHAAPKVPTSQWRKYFTKRIIKRFTMADDLKESSNIA
uniref:Uncharacterized protein n=1 Tax=Tanacetum cinerariifolium TaxID=118510 RepID=A0A699GIV8_TANCI|nr:hypothetical protein [Tanacetum cinerariifolium]GEU78963.1 hypothetical protein [Tanacetum cinerariifolium]